jgi:hypothetical protein
LSDRESRSLAAKKARWWAASAPTFEGAKALQFWNFGGVEMKFLIPPVMAFLLAIGLVLYALFGMQGIP